MSCTPAAFKGPILYCKYSHQLYCPLILISNVIIPAARQKAHDKLLGETATWNCRGYAALEELQGVVSNHFRSLLLRAICSWRDLHISILAHTGFHTPRQRTSRRLHDSAQRMQAKLVGAGPVLTMDGLRRIPSNMTFWSAMYLNVSAQIASATSSVLSIPCSPSRSTSGSTMGTRPEACHKET